VVLVVAMAATITRVSRSQNKIRIVCEAWTVISSSIFELAFSFLFSMFVYGCFF